MEFLSTKYVLGFANYEISSLSFKLHLYWVVELVHCCWLVMKEEYHTYLYPAFNSMINITMQSRYVGYNKGCREFKQCINGLISILLSGRLLVYISYTYNSS